MRVNATIGINGVVVLITALVEKKPHLIGLQEVLNFTIDGANTGPPYPLQAPIILVGDFNSDPQDPVLAGPIIPPYLQLTTAGFVDAWTQHRRGNPDGYTCCQQEDLAEVGSL